MAAKLFDDPCWQDNEVNDVLRQWTNGPLFFFFFSLGLNFSHNLWEIPIETLI